MAYVQGLRCRECAREFDVAPIFTCEWCFGPLEVVYDYDAIAKHTSREAIAKGPLSIWRYADLLPVARDAAIDLGAGFTPLVRADRLAEELGLGEVWLKNDTRNPTNSFKDRVSSVALSKALEFGFKTAACASTGNLANSVAAHAAHAGLRSYVFIPSDLEAGKVVTTSVYGGNVVAVQGNYDDVNRLCAELASTYEWAFVNVNMRPFYAEGSKTLAFETAEQLGWETPDHVVVVAVHRDDVAAIHRRRDDLAGLEVTRDEDVAAQPRVRRVCGHRVGEIAGRRAGRGLEPELERLRQRNRCHPVLERVGRVAGVVLQPHLAEPELFGEPVGAHERREARAEVDRDVLVDR